MIFILSKYLFNIILLFLSVIYAFVFDKGDAINLQIYALISCCALIYHNRKLKISSVLYIAIVSTGMFLLALFDLCHELLLQLFKQLPDLLGQQQIQVLNEIYIMIAILMLIGFIPFMEWIMYLFTISNLLFKIIVFIIPMYLSLLTLQKISHDFSSLSIEIVSFLIAGFSGLHMIFNNKIRATFSYVIVYFYGLQILLLTQANKTSFISLWQITSVLMLILMEIYTPNRAIKFEIKYIKSYVCVNKCYMYTFTLCMLLLVVIFCNNILLFTQNHHYKLYIVIFSPLICLLAKISFLFTQNKQKINIENNKISFKNKTILSATMLTMLLAVFYSYKTTMGFFVCPSIIHILIYFCIFIFTLLFAFFFMNISQPRIFFKKTYSSLLLNVIKIIKITCLIIKSTAIDFIDTLKLKITSLSLSSTPGKLSNILYGNHIYFYIFFLLQVIVILTIECVILQ